MIIVSSIIFFCTLIYDTCLPSVTCSSVMQAVIFVDNSGADIILGILPFARELLRLGVQVWFEKLVIRYTAHRTIFLLKLVFYVCYEARENTICSECITTNSSVLDVFYMYMTCGWVFNWRWLYQSFRYELNLFSLYVVPYCDYVTRDEC